MILENLRAQPLPEVEPGYSIRTYRPGDDDGLVVLWAEIVGGDEAAIRKQWLELRREDPNVRDEDVFFVRYGDHLVGTGTAWKRASEPPDTGYVHMIGVDGAHRGKRLGFLVTVAVLNRLAERGYKRALLNTDDHRLAALKLYLQMGFAPVIENEELRVRWSKVGHELRMKIPGLEDG